MRPYFEEKQYESYFVQEIGRETKLTFAPGQVEEKQLGFDFGCALTPEAWKRCFDKVVEVADGDLGQGASGEVIEKALELLQHTMPPFNMNLFIQFKRSDYMPSARCREFGYWKKPYFRYGIAKDQLATLIALAEGCGELAHVVYAAPVFHKREDLFAAQLAGQVIARSNVVEARELKRPGDCRLRRTLQRLLRDRFPNEAYLDQRVAGFAEASVFAEMFALTWFAFDGYRTRHAYSVRQNPFR